LKSLLTFFNRLFEGSYDLGRSRRKVAPFGQILDLDLFKDDCYFIEVVNYLCNFR